MFEMKLLQMYYLHLLYSLNFNIISVLNSIYLSALYYKGINSLASNQAEMLLALGEGRTHEEAIIIHEDL